MNPNQPLPTPLPPSSYLDQIAAAPIQKTIKPWQLWAMIGGVLLIVVMLFLVLMNGGGTSQSQRMTDLVYRVQALENLTNTSSKQIKNSQLQALSASLNTILTGINQESADSLAVYDIKTPIQAPKDSPVTTEYQKLSTKLEDAELNVVFDRTYAREVAYQLGILQSQMKDIEGRSSNKTVKEFLQKSYDNIAPLQKGFSEFNDSET